MKQVQFMTLEHYDQLKSLSDPLRGRIVSLLIPKSLTGQQLSQELGIPRAKIHYHLNELEKNGLIAVAKNEVKNGIIQKFYRSVARGYYPAAHLLPNDAEVGNFLRGSTIHALERARVMATTAPERAFTVKSANQDEWPRLTVQLQLRTSEERIAAWHKKYRELIQEITELELAEDDPDGKWYYVIASGFEIDEPWFEDTGLENEASSNDPHKQSDIEDDLYADEDSSSEQ